MTIDQLNSNRPETVRPPVHAKEIEGILDVTKNGLEFAVSRVNSAQNSAGNFDVERIEQERKDLLMKIAEVQVSIGALMQAILKAVDPKAESAESQKAEVSKEEPTES